MDDAERRVADLTADLEHEIQKAKDAHYLSKYNEKKQDVLNAAEEKLERKQAIYQSQYKIHQEYVNHKNMLARLEKARKTLEEQKSLRNAQWQKQRAALEARRKFELEKAEQLEKEDQQRRAKRAER